MMNRIKIIIFCCVIFITSCQKVLVAPVQLKPNGVDFFSNSINNISDGDSINFSLPNSGIYTLSMLDTIQNQVISREKFMGKLGVNSLNIYTKSFSQTFLTVVLIDNNGTQINKTKIKIK
jgi:hypothetical protein